MLVLGVEGSADLANDGHPIDENGSHHSEVMHDASPDGNTDPEPENEVCEHCCHGHSVSLVVRTVTANIALPHPDLAVAEGRALIAQSQAPPTPPPKTTV